jgi:hypothetical protein
VAAGTIALLLCVAPAPAEGSNDPDVQVSLAPSVVRIGGSVRCTIRVEPKEANRLLRVSIDGARYYTSSERQLEGESSRATYVFWWRDLPGGEYKITVRVDGNDGALASRVREFRVVGLADDALR